MSNYTTAAATLLLDLGKPTRRGIKRCSKCGVYNGTRGIFCKNKQCGVSLKTFEDHAFDFDAVKLVTGTVRRVYSVQVKDVSKCRGFVQLPLLQSSSEDGSSVLSDVALCFVDSCQRSFDNSILKCHEEGQSNAETEMCDHIKLALKNQALAKPLCFDHYMLKHLKVPNEVREKLSLLSADNECPLVQKVSKGVFAVKCQVTPKQPLGYLHFKFMKGKTRGYEKYYCNCTEYLISAIRGQNKNIKYKCIHYYACVAALCSDPDYSEEFSHFINNEITPRDKSPSFSRPKITKQIMPIDVKRDKINIISNQIIKSPQLRKKEASKSTIKKQKYIIERCKKIVPKIYPIEIKVLNEPALIRNNDHSAVWHFLDWLAFVAESINKTMQFVNCGIVNTQIFYIPEAKLRAERMKRTRNKELLGTDVDSVGSPCNVFFNTISRERDNKSSMEDCVTQPFKERIPDVYVEQKSDIGSVFYSIMNVNHVKEIFDTTKVKLRIAKKFVHGGEKGYIEYDENCDNEAAHTQYHSSFIFFLNVGQSTVDESDNCNNAFIIEWLPSIYNLTEIGQLKFQYKYGKKSI